MNDELKIYHKDLTAVDLHVLQSLIYADEVGRTEDTELSTTDIGRIALQEDNNSFWILRNHVGPVWDPINNSTTTDGQLAQGLELKDYSETVASTTTVSGVMTLDLEDGNVFTTTLTESVDIVVANPPPSGKAGFFTFIITQDAVGTWTINWPESFDSGTTDTTLEPSAGGKTIYTALTTDGGELWYLMRGWRKVS